MFLSMQFMLTARKGVPNLFGQHHPIHCTKISSDTFLPKCAAGVQAAQGVEVHALRLRERHLELSSPIVKQRIPAGGNLLTSIALFSSSVLARQGVSTGWLRTLETSEQSKLLPAGPSQWAK